MTAVEYLIEQLQAPCRGIPSHIIEQAKAMEAKEHDDIYDHGFEYGRKSIEISDDDIEEASRQINYGGGSMGWIKDAFKKGAKWYREQLKKK